MGEEIAACCETARREYEARFLKLVVSYPVIKEFPCPTCRRIIKIRIYAPPESPESA
jgi:hypothetical protein